MQLRRRLRNGFTASGQYTLAKATDDATAFGGASLAGASIAQNWRDLDAEHAPSNFDQRHQFTAQAQYTTGAGLTGGTLVDGLKGRLLKDWTFVGAVHRRQRAAAHAGLSRARAGHRLRGQHPRAADRRRRPTRRRTTI